MYLANIIEHLSVICLLSLIILIPTTIFAQESNPEPVDAKRMCDACAEDLQAQQQQKAKLEGAVINENKEPISNVEIQLNHEGSDEIIHSMSNEKGVFSSPPLSPGKYILTIEKQGYKSFTGDLDLSPGLTRKITIVLVKEVPLGQKTEKEAIESFEKGIEFSKDNKTDDAIRAFQKAVELKPDFAEAHMNLGILLFQQQKYDEAEEPLLKAFELKSEESLTKEILANLNFEKAKISLRGNNLDEALEKLKQAYGFRADHAYVNYLLGYVYYKKEMKDESIKHYEAFLQLRPNAPQVNRVKELLEKIKKEK